MPPQHFAVVVEGAANQAVTWTVDGGGTLTSGGLFTSNGTLGTFYVRATSEAAAVGVAQITVRTPPPPPPAYPCADAACTCTRHLDAVRVELDRAMDLQDYTSVWSSPEVRVRYTGQNRIRFESPSPSRATAALHDRPQRHGGCVGGFHGITGWRRCLLRAGDGHGHTDRAHAQLRTALLGQAD